MPTYIYQTVNKEGGCSRCVEGFEIEQSIKEDALVTCPDCGKKIQRVITPCNFARTHSTAARLSDSNLKKHGFTKLVNEGNGKFRKVT